MKTSPAGRAVIKHFESFSAVPYLCPAQVWTIGWGFTRYVDGRRVRQGDPPITEAEGEVIFDAVLRQFEQDVEDLVTVPLNQGEFDALVSFAWNVGSDIDLDNIAEGLGDSTLLRKLSASDYAGAAAEFPKWNKSRGVVLNGLVRRRAVEQAMFLGKPYTLGGV